MPDQPLYERDFYAWTVDQTAELRALATAGSNSRLDLINLAEEIESLGKSDRREIASRLIVLLAHLLKHVYQPARRSGSWRGTIREQRNRIALVLRDSPSLRGYPDAELAEAYRNAVNQAADDTGLPPSTFPPACPWAVDQVLDEGFMPEAATPPASARRTSRRG